MKLGVGDQARARDRQMLQDIFDPPLPAIHTPSPHLDGIFDQEGPPYKNAFNGLAALLIRLAEADEPSLFGFIQTSKFYRWLWIEHVDFITTHRTFPPSWPISFGRQWLVILRAEHRRTGDFSVLRRRQELEESVHAEVHRRLTSTNLWSLDRQVHRKRPYLDAELRWPHGLPRRRDLSRDQ